MGDKSTEIASRLGTPVQQDAQDQGEATSVEASTRRGRRSRFV